MAETPKNTESASNTLYQFISGQNMANTLPSASSLESLKLLNYFNQAADIDPDIKHLYDQETKYLKSAIKMINNDATIASKFGTDLSASMRLSGLLKEVFAERQAKELLLQYVDANQIDNTPALQAWKQTQGKAISSE